MEWIPVGRVGFLDGKPDFPRVVPEAAGLYRQTFEDGLVLIGTAKKLNVRLNNYRNPSGGVDHENIMHSILLDAHTRNVGVDVAVLVTDELKRERHRREREEIQGAITRKEKILNKGGLGYPHYVAFKVKYYEQMLAAAKDELAALSEH
jgi:hypothetical protein